ncbi:hypothetical protein JCM33374_g3799 [Metschnikowia sp. JCM 33374]|nr:hypothetical protein JCM33374_g3799 [Metschnikowia sp. JCM 33374]
MTNTSQFLLNSLVELNVRVLGLCDSHGMLDVDVRGYSEKLYGFWRNMCSWTEHFQSLEGVAEDIRDLFLDQKIEVEENIENLWGQVP